MDTNRMKEMVRIVYHPQYLVNYSTASCECPDRVRAIMSEVSEQFTVVEPDACGDDDILRCHSDGVLSSEKTNTRRYEVAKLAAGGAIRAAELAMEGFVGFGVIRPPGHHANPDHNWGFCFFNNMGIALLKMLDDGRIRSAVVLDIDLHFGDGTDTIFKSHKNVHVINIQSATPEDFVRETADSLASIRSADIIGISAGFDQYIKDWGANLGTEDYERIGRIAGAFARDRSGGRIFGLLEGGYYIPDLGKNTLALLHGICEGKS